MAENGILDYQGMNQAIYRGATSNIIVDTQSMSIEIGAGNSSHTSNLHIECDHDANVASIQLNSNVVTEFSRSKKLIKYPRVALTSGQSGLSGGYTQDGYTVQASSEWGGTHMTSNVFNGIKNYQYGTPPDYAWLSGGSPDTYTLSTGLATTVDQFQNENGSWVGLALPDKIKLSSVHLYNCRDGSNSVRGAKKGIVWGSDGGSTWYRIKDFGDNTNTDGALNVISVDSNVLYDHFRVQITEIHNSPQKDAVAIGELEFYGVPEYDPDAHGTDVTVKSVPNVPNTDWLEVYYDAKDLTSISGTVADLSGKSVTGSLNGDVSINTSNDVKSFSFDGSGDYIIGNLTNTGDFDFTVSLWLKKNTRDTVGMLWNLGGSGGSGNPEDSVALEVGSSNNLDYFIFSGAEGLVSNFGVDYLNKWVHIVATRTGNNLKIYLDGVDQNMSVSGTDTLQLAANTEFTIGARGTGALGNNPLNGSIANFRIFNRALTTDEIYQLYTYQKEYFGHGDLSMTLKAGRLGIGTSEPRAALDVRGNIQFSLIISHRSINSDTHSTAGRADVSNFNGSTNADASYIPFDTILYENPPGIHNTKVFSCPVKGLYECHADLLTNNGSNYDGDHEWLVNDKSLSVQRRGWATTGNGTRFVQATSHHYIELNAGDTIGIVNRSPQVWYGHADAAHSHMSIRLITPT